MANTVKGTEYHLVGVKPGRSTSPDVVEDAIKGWVREGDAVVRVQDLVYAAFASDVPGAAKATKRIMNLARSIGLDAKITLIPEPFDESVKDAAMKITFSESSVFERKRSKTIEL